MPEEVLLQGGFVPPSKSHLSCAPWFQFTSGPLVHVIPEHAGVTQGRSAESRIRSTFAVRKSVPNTFHPLVGPQGKRGATNTSFHPLVGPQGKTGATNTISPFSGSPREGAERSKGGEASPS